MLDKERKNDTNMFKIELKKILTKELFVEAKNEEEALNLVERIFEKTNLLDNFDEKTIEINAKILGKLKEISYIDDEQQVTIDKMVANSMS